MHEAIIFMKDIVIFMVGNFIFFIRENKKMSCRDFFMHETFRTGNVLSQDVDNACPKQHSQNVCTSRFS